MRSGINSSKGGPNATATEAFTVYEEPGFAQDEDDIDVGFRFQVNGTQIRHSWWFREQRLMGLIAGKTNHPDTDRTMAIWL